MGKDIEISEKIEKYINSFSFKLNSVQKEIIDYNNTYTTITRTASSLSGNWTNDDGIMYKNLDYQIQIQQKTQQIKDVFDRIGNQKDYHIYPIEKCDHIYEYRNKMEFTFSNDAWFEKYNPKEKRALCLGLHPKGRFDKTIDLEECKIQSEVANKITNIVREAAIDNDLIHLMVISLLEL